MKSVPEIHADVERLSAADRRRLADWLVEMPADAWDRQIEDDVKTGRLDHLIAQARNRRRHRSN